MPMPEICFLPGQFRRTTLPKEHHGDSLNGRGSNAQPFDWEADEPSPPQRNVRRQCLNAGNVM